MKKWIVLLILLIPTLSLADAVRLGGIPSRAQMGVDLVDNVRDVDKPVSTQQATAINAKADKGQGFNNFSAAYLTKIRFNNRSTAVAGQLAGKQPSLGTFPAGTVLAGPVSGGDAAPTAKTLAEVGIATAEQGARMDTVAGTIYTIADYASLQAAVDAASAAGGGIIMNTKGATINIASTFRPKDKVKVDLNGGVLKWTGGASGVMVENDTATAGVKLSGMFNGRLDPGNNASVVFKFHSLRSSFYGDLALISANAANLEFMQLYPDAAVDDQDGTHNVVNNIFGPFLSDGGSYSPVVKKVLTLNGSNTPTWSVTTGNRFVGPWDFATNTVGIDFKQYCDSNEFDGMFRFTLANGTTPGTCVVFNSSATPSVSAGVWGEHITHLSCETWYPNLAGQKAVEINHAGGIVIDYHGNDRVAQGSWPVGMVTDNYSQGHKITYVEGAPTYLVKQYIKGGISVQGTGNGVTFPDNSTIISAPDTVSCSAGNHVSAYDPTTGIFTCSADASTGGTSDADAVHDNVSGEIAAVTQKPSPVVGDLLLIEDSTASNAKKKITLGSLPMIQPATAVSTPGAPTLSPVAGGGSVPAATYYYVITAVDASGTESTKGTQQSTTLGATGHVDVSWSAVTGASYYKVYRSTTSGTYSTPSYVIATNGTSTTDKGATALAGAPPSSYTAGNAISFVPGGNSTIRSGYLGIGTDTPTGPIHVVSEGSASNMYFETFNPVPGVANNWSALALNQYAGSKTNKLAVDTGQKVGVVRFGAYDGSAMGSNAAIFGVTSELQTTSAHGMALTFETSANGGTTRSEKMRLDGAGNLGIGQTSPTAYLHMKAGTTVAGTAPLKLAAGTNMTTAEAGAIEWDGTNLFATQTTGPTRKTVAYTDSAITPVAVASTGNVAAKTFTPTIPAAATDGATVTFDLSAGDRPSVTLGGNRTLAFSNPQTGWYTLKLKQDATGSRTVTWPSTGLVCTFIKSDGTNTTTGPTLHTAANTVDTIVMSVTSATTADCYAAGY